MSTRSLTTIFVFLVLISMKLTAYSEPMSGQSPSQLSPPLEISNACIQDFTEHRVQHGENRLYVREYAGTEPPVVLMHGFPDNLHLYDRVVPYLCGRHLILFDFLGWGNRTNRNVTAIRSTIKKRNSMQLLSSLGCNNRF